VLTRTGIGLLLLVVPGGVLGISEALATAKEQERAITELVEVHKKLKSYKAVVHTVEDFEFAGGASVKSEVNGKVAWLRDGQKLLYRADSTSSSVQKFQERESATEAEQTMISDGEFFYTIARMQGTVRVAKQLVDPMLVADAKQVLDALRDEHDVRLVGEETVDDSACYAFEVSPRKPDDSPHMSRMTIHFRKDTGTVIQTVGYGEKGTAVYRSQHREVEINPGLEPAFFEFKPPEGVTIEDYTK
jgi:outer membrane lipoprotein-sorting protein